MLSNAVTLCHAMVTMELELCWEQRTKEQPITPSFSQELQSPFSSSHKCVVKCCDSDHCNGNCGGTTQTDKIQPIGCS